MWKVTISCFEFQLDSSWVCHTHVCLLFRYPFIMYFFFFTSVDIRELDKKNEKDTKLPLIVGLVYIFFSCCFKVIFKRYGGSTGIIKNTWSIYLLATSYLIILQNKTINYNLVFTRVIHHHLSLPIKENLKSKDFGNLSKQPIIIQIKLMIITFRSFLIHRTFFFIK